ncbi:MAG TPA: biotin/lipoyl-binding protein [Bacteroidales bacterium]|nr:biotin/lipoyl-binding protein [Paludibacteraceae bacterium]HOT88345.1 biotin/lipoyl-binding protein [Bacteroidales bacterium]HPS46807.1 biotin/lipoyl-binding protein [Bacteroidales bacterium]HQH18106.1 biotin/lipoyl-binding protein [Bacteroidales bacterium]HQI45543.1 biotin/lipoyl-binding protein [Bacteroidales bacterium]
MENENKEDKQEFQKFTLDGYTYKTLLTKKWLSHKSYVEKDPGKIHSFIPGTILKVFVKDGQKVKKGEQLLILEAMKMHNIITAPMAGKIKKLYVSTAERVANKHLLIEIEPDEIVESSKSKKIKIKRK